MAVTCDRVLVQGESSEKGVGAGARSFLFVASTVLLSLHIKIPSHKHHLMRQVFSVLCAPALLRESPLQCLVMHG